MTEQEKILIAGCVKGDKASWDEFVRQYSNLVYHSIKKTFSLHHADPDSGLVEDLYQEFFVAILRDNERVRSRVFLDILGSRAQLSRLTSGLFEEERELQERLAAIKSRLEEGEIDAGTEIVAERENLKNELTKAEKAYNAFLAKIRKQDKEQASLMTVEPLTSKEVQRLLDPGTTLIEYFVTDSEVLVWVVEKKTNLTSSVLRYRNPNLPSR